MNSYLTMHKGLNPETGLRFADQDCSESLSHQIENESITPEFLRSALLSFSLVADLVDRFENDVEFQREMLNSQGGCSFFNVPLNLEHPLSDYAKIKFYLPITRGFLHWMVSELFSSNLLLL